MSFDYAKMTRTANRLLDRFNQGVIEYVSITTIPAPNDYDLPTETETVTRVNGVVRGVSDKFVDGVTVLASDLQLLADTACPVGGVVRLDGVNQIIVRHDPIPANGTPVTHRYILRS